MLYNKEWEKPAVKLEPWQQVLLEAALYLNTHGWTRGTFKNQLGQVCIMGAFACIVPDMPDRQAAIFTALCEFERYVGQSTASWNDQPHRTKEEVIAALEGAANKGE